MSKDKKKQKLVFETIQQKSEEYNEQIMKNSAKNNNQVMLDLIRNATGSANKRSKVPRLAFAEDPNIVDHYAGIFKIKRKLLPDTIIKQIRVQNLLVAAILRARGNTLSMMGHVRKDRFDVGLDIKVKSEFKDVIEPEQMIQVQDRMDKFIKVLVNCGHVEGLEEHEKMTLPEFFDIQARNGLGFGRFATEIIYTDDSQKEFHRFRPADVGTIYKSVKKGETAEGIRRSSLKLLEQLTGVQIDPKMLEQDEYSWVQVIGGIPKQAFTTKEMIVYNLYPSSDIEHNGYPVTPLDTIQTTVTTHMSVEVYNKLYFQNGRAAKGMLVINSDEIDQAVIDDVKQQFNASINDVTNSFRTPIFGVSKEDKVTWVPTTGQKKDGEFEYLYDQTCRNILAAFGMSPDELPGYGHLSRGSNQQGLSESNNEYKLTAARDTGIRPLILKFQDFVNEKLFPIMDKELSQLCAITLSGFDAQTREQESTRLAADAPLHYNMDTILEETEKDPVGEHMGGHVLFNEAYRTITDNYVDVNKFVGEFFNSPAAWVDPLLRYRRDEFFFQYLETLSQANPRAYAAYFATRKNGIETLKMLMNDYLEEIEE